MFIHSEVRCVLILRTLGELQNLWGFILNKRSSRRDGKYFWVWPFSQPFFHRGEAIKNGTSQFYWALCMLTSQWRKLCGKCYHFCKKASNEARQNILERSPTFMCVHMGPWCAIRDSIPHEESLVQILQTMQQYSSAKDSSAILGFQECTLLTYSRYPITVLHFIWIFFFRCSNRGWSQWLRLAFNSSPLCLKACLLTGISDYK